MRSPKPKKSRKPARSKPAAKPVLKPLVLQLVVDEKDLASKGTLDKANHSIILNQGNTSANFSVQVQDDNITALDKELQQAKEDIANTGAKLTKDFAALDTKEKEVLRLYSVYEKTGKFSQAQNDQYKRISDQYSKQQSTYKRNYEQYELKKKKYAAREKERDALLKAQKDSLSKLRWIWNLCNGKPSFTAEQYRKDIKDGVQLRGAQMPKVYEGGGFGWIEAFLPDQGPQNVSPNGYFIAAKGTPKILATQWRTYAQQNDGAIINTQEKKFREAVQLHIYTQALYGQDLNVELYDTHYVNASLPPYELSQAERDQYNKDKKTPEPKPAASGTPSKPLAKYFQREVKLYPLLEDEKAFIDKIISNYDKSAPSGTDYVVQKAIVNVYLDEIWRYDAGNTLQVHAIVNPVKKDADEYQNDSEYIRVSKVASDDTAAPFNSNTPVIQGEIEVNVSNFKPCKYTGIEFNKEEFEGKVKIDSESEKKVIIYREDASVSPEVKIINTGIIFGSKNRKYNITLQELETNDHICIQAAGSKHPGNTFKILKQPGSIINVQHDDDKVLRFDARVKTGFVKLNYIWPISPVVGEIETFSLRTETCRHDHTINIGMYPDIGWNVKFYYTPKYAFTNIQDISYLRPHAVTEAYQNYRNSETNDVAAGLGENMAVKLGFKMECTFDGGTEEITKDFINKIWRTVSLFQKLSNYVNDLAGSSGVSPSQIGVGLKIKQTELAFIVDWKAVEKKDTNGIQQVGVETSVSLEAKPLVGAEITIDLLKTVATMANPGVGKVISALKDFEFKGNDENYLRSQLSFDLILFGNINLSGNLKFNTIERNVSGNINGSSTIGVKAYLGYKLSGKVTFVVTGEVEGEASMTGEASVTGGLEIGAEKGFYILPIVKFNGLLVKFVFKGSVKGGWVSKGFDLSPKEPITLLPPYPKSGDSIFDKYYPFK